MSERYREQRDGPTEGLVPLPDPSRIEAMLRQARGYIEMASAISVALQRNAERLMGSEPQLNAVGKADGMNRAGDGLVGELGAALNELGGVLHAIGANAHRLERL